MESVTSSSNQKKRQADGSSDIRMPGGSAGQIMVLLLLLAALLGWDAIQTMQHGATVPAGGDGDCSQSIDFCAGHARLPWPGASLLCFQPLDINAASLEELVLLPGVGEKGASRLINFRMERGFLLSVNEIDLMAGFPGRSRFECIKMYLTVKPWKEKRE